MYRNVGLFILMPLPPVLAFDITISIPSSHRDQGIYTALVVTQLLLTCMLKMFATSAARARLANSLVARRGFSTTRSQLASPYHYAEGPRSNIPFNPLTRFFAVRYWAFMSTSLQLSFFRVQGLTIDLCVSSYRIRCSLRHCWYVFYLLLVNSTNLVLINFSSLANLQDPSLDTSRLNYLLGTCLERNATMGVLHYVRNLVSFVQN
jgi:hypothetical protein